MSQVVPADLHKWTKEQIAKAGLPTDEVATVKGTNFASFTITSPALLTVDGGADSSTFHVDTVDQQHKGQGYVCSSYESGKSTGQLSTSSWDSLRASYYITATITGGSIYVNFADSSSNQVGFYSGSWGGSSVQSANGYFWWNK